jgi:hypothetical protein
MKSPVRLARPFFGLPLLTIWRSRLENNGIEPKKLCGEATGKVLALVEEQHKPEHRHDQRARHCIRV